MGKVSMAVRSAAMSHIEPRLPTILGRANMRMKLLKIVVVLLLSGSGYARPQDTGEPRRAETNSMEWVPIVPRAQEASSSRHSKDLQNIDQSLRTVATQLLNVTGPKEEPPKILDNVINKSSQKPIDRNEATPVKEIHVNNGPASFSRPVNSKFNYFESSHPGQAMAITEEELEKELSSTRLMTAYKNQPTTTGGISTWILLNPPSTTVKTIEMKPSFETTAKIIVKPTTLMERVDTTEKVTIPVSTTIVEPSTTKKSVSVTTKKPEKVTEKTVTETESVQSTTLKVPQTTVNVESKEAVTTKKVPIRTTAKPKTTTVKTVSKPPKNQRPNQQNRPKPPNRRTTVKPDAARNDSVSTGKIEKVTFRPVQMITTPKTRTESTEKPMFVTKIKASILMDTQKTTTTQCPVSTTSLETSTTAKSTTTKDDLLETKPKPVGTKVNNVLKVQLKKPLDESTKIEIEPIKVNAPVLQIEKVEKTDTKDKETEGLSNTRIDLMKFDFNPELTKINVNTEVSSSTTSTTPSTTSTSTSTTKRPRHNSKRKKNKTRRRKPSVSTSTVSTLTSSTTTEFELAAEEPIENGIQESKIAPETKVAGNSTKTKKKPASTPVSMQIYNFLSREVMPSFGVMSLVGLGLGLASYFLYPFGGTVTRRNYEVEPKYKYNFEEYGGSYGQSEEEVLAKVLQGMTTDDAKYPGSKDYDNYYKYQHYDGTYEATKKNDQRNPSSSPIYRSEKHRNTDYRYSDAQSTPNYYERPKHSEYVVGSAMPSSVNRQFVVGNVPKEYPNYDEKIPALPNPEKLVDSYEPTDGQFNHDVNQNFKYPVGSSGYDQIQTARPDETYEEVEITPTAVAVEHGPRSLRKKRSLLNLIRSRGKRDTVIQIIPTKRELEEEEKEDDLSNEIFNIIDSALPEKDGGQKKDKHNEVENFDHQRRKEKDEETTRLKESTTKNQNSETSTVPVATKEGVESSTLAPTTETTTGGSKTTEQSVEWSESTDKPTEQNGFNLFNFVKKIAEIKLRLGLTLLKHASEGFAKYLGHVQKRINGEE